LGFTCVNDVTARDLQNRDPQWTRAKGFDTFCPVGPCLLEGGPGDGSGFALETRVNGELRQQASTNDFIFSLQRIFAAITAVMTLEPGDLIATGTPAAGGPFWLWRYWHRPTPEQIECARRLRLHAIGRIAGGEILEMLPAPVPGGENLPPLLVYQYEFAGVTYQASQANSNW